ncbi:hypothetical protein [Bradyrhizobium sp. ORS 285]|uniref:hypothetical protein n=1 Tax=Bradyrhizobium sp. ORS 285 TaxID=115808 RepID=UPI0002D36050|nr:hypothetical protein [Bradyrhizobium sp. ORS 285]
MTRYILTVAAALLVTAVTVASSASPAAAGRFIGARSDISNKPAASPRLPPLVNQSLIKKCREEYYGPKCRR